MVNELPARFLFEPPAPFSVLAKGRYSERFPQLVVNCFNSFKQTGPGGTLLKNIQRADTYDRATVMHVLHQRRGGRAATVSSGFSFGIQRGIVHRAVAASSTLSAISERSKTFVVLPAHYDRRKNYLFIPNAQQGNII